MNIIYTITTIKPAEKWRDYKTRSPGFFFKERDAVEAVESNHGQIEDKLYDYCVIEKLFEGVYAYYYEQKDDQIWFIWDLNEKKWTRLKMKPDWAHGFCNWALG